MGTRKPQTEWIEQIIPAVMNTDETNYVVMKNELILGEGKAKGKNASGLSLNAMKLLRLTIMQCVRSDVDFRPYQISISELAHCLKIDSSNLYKSVQDICLSLLSEVVLIGDGNPKHSWNAFQWISRCEYDGNGVLTIQLHDDMKPYILGLKSHYTQYEIGAILELKSIYALRIYELIKMELKNQPVYADKKAQIYLSCETIRRATGTTKKYKQINDFTRNVIDMAIKEINKRPFGIFISYIYRKSGRKIVGYEFEIAKPYADVKISLEKMEHIQTVRQKAKKTRIIQLLKL